MSGKRWNFGGRIPDNESEKDWEKEKKRERRWV